jgi:phosphate transport system substrate-binding protein
MIRNNLLQTQRRNISMFKKSILTALLVMVTAAASHAAPTTVDAKIAKYKPASGVAGNLGSIGSDTLNNLMTYWAEGFKKKYPNVNIQIEGKGSSTAPPALIAGTAQLGPMSREMKSTELEQFEKKYGYKPTKIGVALDSLAVYVNKDNPITSLSLDEVDAIFSSTRKRGVAEITTWGQLGVTGKLAAMPISLYGRNSASGTYGYFKEHTLKGGDYKNTVKEQPVPLQWWKVSPMISPVWVIPASAMPPPVCAPCLSRTRRGAMPRRPTTRMYFPESIRLPGCSIST